MRDTLRFESIEAIANYFNLGPIEKAYQMGSTNVIYAITTNKGAFFLKIFLQRSIEDLKKEFVYLMRLEEYNFPIPHFLSSSTGSNIFCNDDLTAIAMQKANGEVKIGSESVVSEVGLHLAQLHNIPLYSLPQKSHWFAKGYLSERIEKAMKSLDLAERDKLTILYEALRHLDPDTFPQGVIHGDLRPPNCLFEESKLTTILDWEDVGIGACLLDFAWCALSFCFIKNTEYKPQINMKLFNKLIECYSITRPFTAYELENIENAIRYVYLTFIVWILPRLVLRNKESPKIPEMNTLNLY